MFDIEASVPSGLESTALDEVKETLGVSGGSQRGRISFAVTSSDQVKKVVALRSIDYAFAVVLRCEATQLQSVEKEDALAVLKNLVAKVSWQNGLQAWENVVGPLPGGVARSMTHFGTYGKKSSGDEPEKSRTDDEDDWIACRPKFRVTCFRKGRHKFISNEAAAAFGGRIQDTFLWAADMTAFDVHVVLEVVDNRVKVSLALNKRCLSFRNVVSYSPTSLRASIAYGLLRHCRLKEGEPCANPGSRPLFLQLQTKCLTLSNKMVCDPMCGSGSIILEAIYSWPHCHYVMGDHHPIGMQKCWTNLETLPVRHRARIDACRWDATRLPLTTDSINCFVCDLPFGKRIGSFANNRVLYPKALKEMARVAKVGEGRACLMTNDKRTMIRCLKALSSYWKCLRAVSVNVGGLKPCIYQLQRTEAHLQSSGPSDRRSAPSKRRTSFPSPPWPNTASSQQPSSPSVTLFVRN